MTTGPQACLRVVSTCAESHKEQYMGGWAWDEKFQGIEPDLMLKVSHITLQMYTIVFLPQSPGDQARSPAASASSSLPQTTQFKVVSNFELAFVLWQSSLLS